MNESSSINFVPNEVLIEELSGRQPIFKQAMQLPEPSGIEKELKNQKAHKEKVREAIKTIENVGRVGAGITVGVAVAGTALLATAATVVGIGLAAGFIVSNPVGWGVGGALAGAALLGATIGAGAGIIALLCKGHIWHDVLKPALIGLSVAMAMTIVAIILGGVVLIAGSGGGPGEGVKWPSFQPQGWGALHHRHGGGFLAGMGTALLLHELRQAPITLPGFEFNLSIKEFTKKKRTTEIHESLNELTKEQSEQVMVIDKNTPPEKLQETFNIFVAHIEEALSENLKAAPGNKDYSAIEDVYKRSTQLVKNNKYDEALDLLRFHTRVEYLKDSVLSIDIARLAMMQKMPQDVRADSCAQIEAMRHSNDPILALNLAKCLYKIDGFKEHAQSIVALQAMLSSVTRTVDDQFSVEAEQWLKSINYRSVPQTINPI